LATANRPMFLAAKEGRTEEVRRLMANGADLAATNDETGETALHVAGRMGQAAVAQLLADGGADMEAREPRGHTPLHSAAGHPAVVKVLLQAGAEVEAKNGEGCKPLHEAASGKEIGHAEVTKMLLDAGSDAAAGSYYGDTPLHYATMGGDANIAKMLLASSSFNLEIGRAVWLKGLVARPDLNGEAGQVTSFVPATSRRAIWCASQVRRAPRGNLNLALSQSIWADQVLRLIRASPIW